MEGYERVDGNSDPVGRVEVKRDVVEFYKDTKDEWRWRRRTANGNIVSDGSEGYKNRGDCVTMAARVNGGSYGTIYVDND